MLENTNKDFCDVIGGCLLIHRKLSLLAPFLFASAIAHADAVNAEWLSTTRSLSMGNVGIATAEDAQTAMFYNPAALARTKKTVIEIFNPQIEMGASNFSIAQQSNGHYEQSKLSTTVPLLQNKRNRVSSLGASLYPNIHTQNFNFGILAKAEGASYINSDGVLTYKSRYLMMPSLGLSAGALGGRFKLGVALRAIQLTENNKQTSTLSGVGYTVNAAEGWGFGVDAGALLSFPWAGLPTFGFVARNIGGTQFGDSAPIKVASGSAVSTHKGVKMTYDGGFALFPKFGRQNTMTIGVDYRDILNNTNTEVGRKVNAGMELGFRKTFYLRGGYGRGYWTAGLGLHSKYGGFDIGTYGEEMSDNKFRDRESRRITLRYGSKF